MAKSPTSAYLNTSSIAGAGNPASISPSAAASLGEGIAQLGRTISSIGSQWQQDKDANAGADQALDYERRKADYLQEVERTTPESGEGYAAAVDGALQKAYDESRATLEGISKTKAEQIDRKFQLDRLQTATKATDSEHRMQVDYFKTGMSDRMTQAANLVSDKGWDAGAPVYDEIANGLEEKYTNGTLTLREYKAMDKALKDVRRSSYFLWDAQQNPSKYLNRSETANAGSEIVAKIGHVNSKLTRDLANQAGLPPEFFFSLIGRESKGQNIETTVKDREGKRASTASGYFQITDPTLRGVGGTGRAMNLSYEGQLRAAIAISKKNEMGLSRKLGRSPKMHELYMAWFLGEGTAGTILKAYEQNPNTPISSVVKGRVYWNHRSVFTGDGGRSKTIAEFKADLQRDFPEAGQYVNSRTESFPEGKMTKDNWGLSFYQPWEILGPKEGQGWVDARAAIGADNIGSQFMEKFGVRVTINEKHSFQGTHQAGANRGTREQGSTIGATRSQHKEGKAFDFQVRDLPDNLKSEFLKTALENGATGIGFYPDAKGGHLHVDFGRKRTWGAVPGWAKEIVASDQWAARGRNAKAQGDVTETVGSAVGAAEVAFKVNTGLTFNSDMGSGFTYGDFLSLDAKTVSAIQKQSLGLVKQDFEMRVADALVQLQTTGSQTLLDDADLANYERNVPGGAEKVAAFRQAEVAASDYHSMLSMSANERAQFIQDAKPDETTPADQMAEQQATYEARIASAKSIASALTADPYTFVRDNDEAVKAALGKAAEAGTPKAWEAAIRMSIESQQANGLAATDIRVMPKSLATSIAQELQNAETSGAVTMRLTQMRTQFGAYFGRAIQQMVKDNDLPPAYLGVALLNNESLQNRLVLGIKKGEANPDFLKAVNSDAKKAYGPVLSSFMESFGEAGMGDSLRNRVMQEVGLESALKVFTADLMEDGIEDEEAGQQAAQLLIGSNWSLETVGTAAGDSTVRIPTASGASPSAVTTGLGQFYKALEGYGDRLTLPQMRSASGLTQEETDKIQRRITMDGSLRFITTPDDQGVYVMDGTGRHLMVDGVPLSVSFKELEQIGEAAPEERSLREYGSTPETADRTINKIIHGLENPLPEKEPEPQPKTRRELVGERNYIGFAPDWLQEDIQSGRKSADMQMMIDAGPAVYQGATRDKAYQRLKRMQDEMQRQNLELVPHGGWETLPEDDGTFVNRETYMTYRLMFAGTRPVFVATGDKYIGTLGN